jgi:hypothetical protein
MILKIALENSEDGRWFAILLSSDQEVSVFEQTNIEKSEKQEADKVASSKNTHSDENE